MSKEFAALHTHSNYSVLESVLSVDDIFRISAKKGATSVALTDTGNMHGAIEFLEKKNTKTKPIFGMEVLIEETSRFSMSHTQPQTLVLLAQNNKGWENLLTINSKSHLETSKEFPCVDFELLEKYKEGIICLSGGDTSLAFDVFMRKGGIFAEKIITKIHSIFKENFYLECIAKKSQTIKVYNLFLQKLSKKLSIESVVCCPTRYESPEEQKSEEVNIPVIASGGAGSKEHFKSLFMETKATGGLAASIFHYGELKIPHLKHFLKNNKIPIRCN